MCDDRVVMVEELISPYASWFRTPARKFCASTRTSPSPEATASTRPIAKPSSAVTFLLHPRRRRAVLLPTMSTSRVPPPQPVLTPIYLRLCRRDTGVQGENRFEKCHKSSNFSQALTDISSILEKPSNWRLHCHHSLSDTPTMMFWAETGIALPNREKVFSITVSNLRRLDGPS